MLNFPDVSPQCQSQVRSLRIEILFQIIVLVAHREMKAVR